MDQVYRDAAVLDRPVGEICSAAMPMIGIGEPVARVVECARAATVGARARRRPPDRRARRAPTCSRSSRRARHDRDRTDEHESAFETRAIHAGQEPDATTGAVVPPISLATTFAQDAVGVHRGYEYARSGNPTRSALEDVPRVARRRGQRPRVRERPRRRGRAAAHARSRRPRRSSRPTRTAAPSGSSRACTSASASTGPRSTSPISTRSTRRGRDATRMVWIETPTNPALSIVDIAAIAQLAHARGARVVVDNTFATPYLQQPLALGADAVVHSSTKYLGGHSDVVGGFVAVHDAELADELRFLQNAMGAVPSPFDCYLVLRGVQDARGAHGPPLRERRCDRARCSSSTTRSTRVLYPGLADHPGHEVAARQMKRLRRHGLVHARAAARTPRSTSSRARDCSRSPNRSARSSR